MRASISSRGAVLAELDGARLRVAPHRADPDAYPVDGHRRLVPEDLVPFLERLPFLAAPAAVDRAVDPREEARGKRRSEPAPREAVVREDLAYAPIDREGGRSGVREGGAHRLSDRRHLRGELAHVRCPRPGGGLVGHGRHPLHEAGPEEARERHQQKADGAVRAAEVAPAAGETFRDHVRVHRIEDEHRPGLHAKGRGGVDPVAVPAGGAEARVDRARVVASLAGDDDVVPGERADVVRVAEPPGIEAEAGRTRPARRGGRVERGRDPGEVAFLPHPLEQHRADQPPPADEPDVRHVRRSRSRARSRSRVRTRPTAGQAASNSPAAPWPPPMHIVTTP